MLKREYWILDPVFNVWDILSKKKKLPDGEKFQPSVLKKF